MKSFQFESFEEGVEISLCEKKRSLFRQKNLSLNVSDWEASNDPDILRGLVALGPIIQELENPDVPSVTVSHSFVAQLSDNEARSLGFHFQFRINFEFGVKVIGLMTRISSILNFWIKERKYT